jgi:3-phosphoshikimate 1-carboxyvinyltransferase
MGAGPAIRQIGVRLARLSGRCQKPHAMTDQTARPRSFAASAPLKGRIAIPGDKSISHRALMLSALAVGTSRVSGLLEGHDVLATAAAMRAMGASIERTGDGEWVIDGVGVGGLLQPREALDMGNSGTSTRLLMGLVSSHPITTTFTGDASLSGRPMGRVIDPLSRPRARGADRISASGRLGAGQVGDPARRPQYAGNHHRDRTRADARP